MARPELAISEAGLVYRIRAPQDARRGVILTHGLGGDEGVMWVFESALPEDWIAAAPRGLFPAPDGGWGWTRAGKEHLSSASEFEEAIGELRGFLARMSRDAGVGEDAWVWMGFSQGAALAFASALAPGARPAGVVSLAGFLPEGADAEALSRLRQVPVYWGHGAQDDLVPIGRARRDVQTLRAASVDVTYCEAEVGHKLGVGCLRGLKTWLEARC
jgi:phospholipase/carboxylesterase